MRANKWIGIASAVGTAAAAGSAYVRYRHDLKDRNRALKSAHRQVETGLGAIEYAREGTGPAALVIHGAGGGFDQGLYLGRKMLGAGFDLIAPSRFGYLGTPSPAETPRTIALSISSLSSKVAWASACAALDTSAGEGVPR
jgi:2-hydroxy-6-oxonona-2,4-dienedioate hydrolase